MIHGMNHFTVLTDDLDKTLGFYVDLLGLKPGPRPDLGFPGRVVVRGRYRCVAHHRRSCAYPKQRAGVIDHMAFSASGLADVKAKLDAKKISYELRRQRGAGTWQLFCHDPSGAKVELDFDPSESA